MSKFSANLSAIQHLGARLPDNGGDLAKSSRALINRVEAAAAALANLHDSPDPMLSKLAINMRVEAARAEIQKIASEGRSQSAALLAKIRTNVEVQRAQTANLQPSPHAQEIRTVFRQMSTADKLQYLADAIDRNDGEFIASLVTVPHFLAGLTAEQSGAYKKLYLEKVAPIDTGSIDATEEVVTGVLGCADDLLAS